MVMKGLFCKFGIFPPQRFYRNTPFSPYMAKPIESTPTLKGEDAVRFLRGVFEEQKNPSPERIRILTEASKIKFKVEV